MHDHDHDHEYEGLEHGTDCACGCHDHDHEGHEHHHEHDHEGHHHEHEKALIEEEGVYLGILDHDGSLVASYRFTLPGSLDAAKERLSEFAKAVAAEVDAREGIVGHIKAFARSQGDACRVSLTTDAVDIADFPGESVLVEGVAIVLAVDEAWYEEFITEQVRALLA